MRASRDSACSATHHCWPRCGAAQRRALSREQSRSPVKDSTVQQIELDVALELHLHGGGGDYSTAIYWDNKGAKSSAGKTLADDICAQFQAGLSWHTIGAKPQSYFQRSLAFLNDTRMPAVIIEPAFKDNDIQPRGQPHRPAPYSTPLVFAGIQRYAMRWEGHNGRATE